jgi:hypothetical protein
VIDMSEFQKIDQPSYVKITAISKGIKEEDFVFFKARFNPYNVASYYETFFQKNQGQDIKKVVCFVVSGVSFCVDMTIEEADEMMENIDRSLSIKED